MDMTIIIIASIIMLCLLVWVFIHSATTDYCDKCGADMIGETEGCTVCTLCDKYEKGEVV